jgi:hypothetical protein
MTTLSQFMDGKKTMTGIAITLLPVIAPLFGVDVSAAFPQEFSHLADAIFNLIGAALAVYGYAVSKGPGWFAKK